MPKRSVIPVLIISLGLASVSVQGDSGNDSASGHVNNWGGNDVDIDFSARSNFNGTQARGYARFAFRTFDPDSVVTGEVTCLVVIGGVATIGGIITDVRGGLMVVGNAFVISATDSGKFSTAPDTVGAFLGLLLPPETFTDGAPCVTPTFELPVTEGEIVIHDALT
jgi:hypothetical protein